MVTFVELGATCQCCNGEYLDEPKPEGDDEYTCPCCQTVDTINNLLEEAQNRVDYDMVLRDIIVVRENLSIIDNWLYDVAYLIKEK